MRRGFADVLAEHPAIQVVASVDHAGVEAVDWNAVDVVFVDAADESLTDDQFPGVDTVLHIRRSQHHRATVTIVTGHFLHDGLRWRMKEAGADFFYSREDVRTPEAVLDLALNPGHGARGVPPVQDAAAIEALGVREYSRVNLALEHLRRARAWEALGGFVSRPDARSRKWARLRAEVAATGRIVAANADGIPPHRDAQVSPSVTQLRRFYAWFTQIRPGEQ